MMDLLYDFILYRTVCYFWGRGFVAEKFGAVRVTLDLLTCRHRYPPAQRVIYNVFREIGASRKMPFREEFSDIEDWERAMINSKHETNNGRNNIIVRAGPWSDTTTFLPLFFFFFSVVYKTASKNAIMWQ